MYFTVILQNTQSNINCKFDRLFLHVISHKKQEIKRIDQKLTFIRCKSYIVIWVSELRILTTNSFKTVEVAVCILLILGKRHISTCYKNLFLAPSANYT